MLTDKDTDTSSGANIDEYLFTSSPSLPIAFSVLESSVLTKVSQ